MHLSRQNFASVYSKFSLPNLLSNFNLAKRFFSPPLGVKDMVPLFIEPCRLNWSPIVAGCFSVSL